MTVDPAVGPVDLSFLALADGNVVSGFMMDSGTGNFGLYARRYSVTGRVGAG